MSGWIDELSKLISTGEPAVLVTVAGIKGSAPREIGAKMVVTSTESIGTIGGGQLEYQCTRIACELLGNESALMLRRFPLGVALGQCCGGVVDVLFEAVDGELPAWLIELTDLHRARQAAVLCTALQPPGPKGVVTADSAIGPTAQELPDAVLVEARNAIEASRQAYRSDSWLYEPIVGNDLNIAVFGAGHVGAAVVHMLSALDCDIRWIDSRPDIFKQVPKGVRAIQSGDPVAEAEAMPAGSYFIVMTHSHALDFDVCARILTRGDAAYCGLIGSRSKRSRFEKRFRAQDIPDDTIATLVCPIGIDAFSGKKPAEIALSVSVQILQVYQDTLRNAAAGGATNVRPLQNVR